MKDQALFSSSKINEFQMSSAVVACFKGYNKQV